MTHQPRIHPAILFAALMLAALACVCSSQRDPRLTEDQQATVFVTSSTIASNLPAGSVDRGWSAFRSYRCTRCHEVDGSAEGEYRPPDLMNVAYRIPYGYDSPEHYLVEAIWYPEANISGIAYYMPQDFALQMEGDMQVWPISSPIC